jgi:hypothetical protein
MDWSSQFDIRVYAKKWIKKDDSPKPRAPTMIPDGAFVSASDSFRG